MTSVSTVDVVRPGALTTIQDLGRIGWAHLGVPRSGALDAPALRLANRLAGNPLDAAGLETTLNGCTLRFASAATVAVTGADAVVTLAGEPAAHTAPLRVRPSDTLVVGPARAGVRSYVAISGGIDVPPVLGSRSTDTLSGLGPPPLRRGDTLSLGIGSASDGHDDNCRAHGVILDPDCDKCRALAVIMDPGDDKCRALAVILEEESSKCRALAGIMGGGDSKCRAVASILGGTGDGLLIGVRAGPRDDWFASGAFEVLCGSAYTVGVNSNRVGARLAGPPLHRADLADLASVPPRRGNPTELPSEGLVLGAVQIASDGQPTVMLADHPTTGGYPVIAVVDGDDVALFAQARPGATVRFHGL